MTGILSTIVYFPLVGALVLAFIPKNKEVAIKWTSLVVSIVPFSLSVIAYASYNFSAGGFQFVEKAQWIKAVGIGYFMGADGISLPLLVLTTLLMIVSILYSFTVKLRVKEYFVMLLILASAMSGVFVALDYILFYIFWEIGLVPMYFLIGIWGGRRKEYAAIKFFLYTLFGSVFMLLGIIGLYYFYGTAPGHEFTFNMITLYQANPTGIYQALIFFAIFLGLAIKLPLFPFHTWLPDAHVEAPTAGSVLLAGILLKMGGYGFIRILMPSVPKAFKTYVPLMAILAIMSIIYGAYLAMSQNDLKKMVAYSSISHMGFVIIGYIALNKIGINGAVFQMVSHGLITGMMFMLVGLVHDRYHTRNISELHGLIWQIPILSSFIIFGSLASAGLPSLSGFIGEVQVIMGAIIAKEVVWALASGLGIILTFGYYLMMLSKINLRQPKKGSKMFDLDVREIIMLSPITALIIILGIYPAPVLRLMESGVVKMMIYANIPLT